MSLISSFTSWNRNSEFDAYAQRVSKATGLPILRIAYGVHERRSGETAVICPSVGRFLSLFFGAEIVLTDSFHGTAFSVNLEKRFVSVSPGRFSGRIAGFLEKMDLSERYLNDCGDVDLALEDIDFTEIVGALEKERNKAKGFLTRAVEL